MDQNQLVYFVFYCLFVSISTHLICTNLYTLYVRLVYIVYNAIDYIFTSTQKKGQKCFICFGVLNGNMRVLTAIARKSKNIYKTLRTFIVLFSNCCCLYKCVPFQP